MSNYINKYLNQSAYDADDTKQYPNVSYISGSDEVVFKMQADPEPVAFGGLTVKYNIVDPSVEVTLFNGGGSSSSSSSESSSESGSGGGGVMPTTMIVDGVEETPINTWRFETTGEHTVQYTFEDNVVPSNFLSGNTIATEAIIGDDIIEIGNEAFNCNLTTATIGTGITSIGDSAFYDYGSFTDITIEATIPPTLGIYSLSGDYPIYVPAESVNAYKTESLWLDYASRIFAIS